MIPSTPSVLVGLSLAVVDDNGWTRRHWRRLVSGCGARSSSVCRDARGTPATIIRVRIILREPFQRGEYGLCVAQIVYMMVRPIPPVRHLPGRVRRVPSAVELCMRPASCAYFRQAPAASVWLTKTGLLLPLVWAGSTLITAGFGLYVGHGPELSQARIAVFRTLATARVALNLQSDPVAPHAGGGLNR